jgi:hypothetical protein
VAVLAVDIDHLEVHHLNVLLGDQVQNILYALCHRKYTSFHKILVYKAIIPHWKEEIKIFLQIPLYFLEKSCYNIRRSSRGSLLPRADHDSAKEVSHVQSLPYPSHQGHPR